MCTLMTYINWTLKKKILTNNNKILNHEEVTIIN